ncbi:MAG: DUF1848 domain-containing protein [Oscillospiraceae bacterium]|nr:DUF1848 domain-containing protein [Oscillospiraceae bacterium]
MIIQTGNRTDIPAFYAKWFSNRLKEGFVLVRNPFNPGQITRYELDPSVVDLIIFCTKNPLPLMQYRELVNPFKQYWFVTITPYGKDIEPNVPDKQKIIEGFKTLSGEHGIHNVCWRYDSVILNEYWTEERHIRVFSRMCEMLSGYTDTCVISFIDLYEKVKRNYPEIKEVPFSVQMRITEAFVRIADQYGICIKPCGESSELEKAGADVSGCLTVKTMEKAIGMNLNCPPAPRNRKECACYITGDIGQYNTCGHLCRYCYANADPKIVKRNMAQHDPSSPLLIGNVMPGDKIHRAKQKSWVDPQLRFDFI